MRRWLLPVALGSAFFVGSLNQGCKSSTGTGGTGGADEGIPALRDVVYEGGATDEALKSLLDATATADTTNGASFTSLADGAMLSASSAPKFTWAVGAKSTRGDPARHDFVPSRFMAPADSAPKSVWNRAASGLVKELLSGVPVAHAHGTPTSGPAYFVLFSTSKNDKLLRVFTVNLDYTPDAASLAKLTGAGEAIHAIITNAEFDANRIAQDGGPYQGTGITFTIQ